MLHRRSIRLKNYDYSRSGIYFITICTHSRQSLFGEITDRIVHLNEAGEAARKCWLEIPSHYPEVSLDEFVIMPDHLHGIIVINNQTQNIDVGINDYGIPTMENRNLFQHIIPRSVGSIIRGFKIGVTKWFRERSPGKVVWQRNFYEHIIEDELELCITRLYIRKNPEKWKVKF